ncbi:hypothetical protein B0O80DRAFT_432547 [Mortierella sp. GBAus27b]|nr:hypothetical protein B0O80DRAFT_432541 [Mortierella sp. GBAus27b]KAI8363035.1 hypothetical protein B0O80DRAFT_432547 [Mortierella sp. GBAus27b]
MARTRPTGMLHETVKPGSAMETPKTALTSRLPMTKLLPPGRDTIAASLSRSAVKSTLSDNLTQSTVRAPIP